MYYRDRHTVRLKLVIRDRPKPFFSSYGRNRNFRLNYIFGFGRNRNYAETVITVSAVPKPKLKLYTCIELYFAHDSRSRLINARRLVHHHQL